LHISSYIRKAILITLNPIPLNFLIYEGSFLFFFNSVIISLFRFLISRHPFARLASAYRNKLEDRKLSHDGEYFFNTYSTQIIRYSIREAGLLLQEQTGGQEALT
jgi:hypothetical protein